MRALFLIVLAVVALAGCGGPSTTPAPSPTPAPPPSVVTPTSTPTPTPTPLPPPPAPATLPAAADGTNLGACRDGTCEVEVRGDTTIPLASRFGMNGLEIISVSPGSVDYGASTGNGNTIGSSGGPGDTNTVQKITVTVVAIDGDRAVIALRPA